MWDGNHYRCTGCGEVYGNNYVVCPSCHAPCEVVEDAGGGSNCATSSDCAFGDDIVVAEILRCEKFIGCQLYKIIVDDGNAYWPVVSGAPNCRVGLKTALARVGAKVRDYQTGALGVVKKRIIRGEYSSGLLCSGREIAYPVGDIEGIVEFCPTEMLGKCCREVEYIVDPGSRCRICAPWQIGFASPSNLQDVDAGPCVTILSAQRDAANENLFWLNIKRQGCVVKTFGYGNRFGEGQIMAEREIEGLNGCRRW